MLTAHEKTVMLLDHGYYIGPRDPERNTDFQGTWMVAEPLPDDVKRPTKDAGDGAYCIVGDNLSKLIDEAYDHNFNW
jgi:hypothetical protein